MNKDAMGIKAPIGFLDSGLGGLTVLKAASEILPEENFVYYADFKNSPYGGRPKDEVIDILGRAVSELMKKGIKALVFACNTATIASVEVFRKRLSIPVIGMEPALKPAVLAAPGGTVLVLATELTLKEEKFRKLYESYRDKANIILKSCPGLVELIDSGEPGEKVDMYLSGLLSDYKNVAIHAVVLGCTHYVLVKDAIARQLSPGAACMDGNLGVSRRLSGVLAKENLCNHDGLAGRVEYLSSDKSKLSFLENRYKQLGKGGE